MDSGAEEVELVAEVDTETGLSVGAVVRTVAGLHSGPELEAQEESALEVHAAQRYWLPALAFPAEPAVGPSSAAAAPSSSTYEIRSGQARKAWPAL